MKKALGLIETIGLATAIEAADAAVKAADVTLLGYENTKGGGKITIKLAGGVGAVKAAVAAGVAAASRMGQVYGQHIIARPHDEIQALIDNLDRGRGAPETVAMPEVEAEAEEELEKAEPTPESDEPTDSTAEATTEVTSEAMVETVSEVTVADSDPAPALCRAVTKSGDRCKLPALANSDYCFVHRKQDEMDDIVE
ncbi:MAG: BMC domain-containing protein [Chloroflexota bacterium]